MRDRLLPVRREPDLLSDPSRLPAPVTIALWLVVSSIGGAGIAWICGG